jgi:hypothetical protein
MKEIESLKKELELEVDDPENRLEIENEIKTKTNLVQSFKNKINQLQSKLEELTVNKAVIDENASSPYNIHKLANLWLQKILYKFVKHIIEEMIDHVPIPDILDQLIEENGSDEFSNIRYLIFQLLDKDIFDQELLAITNRILDADTFHLCQEYQVKLQQGVYPANSNCIICGHPLARRWSDEKTIRIESNGSSYHLSCFVSSKRKKIITPDIVDPTMIYEKLSERVRLADEALGLNLKDGKMTLYRNIEEESALVSVNCKKKNSSSLAYRPYQVEWSLVEEETRIKLETLAQKRRFIPSKQISNNETSVTALKNGKRELSFVPKIEASIRDKNDIKSLYDLLAETNI